MPAHYSYKVAYRHQGGAVEGFKGTGFTKAAAKADAMTQIHRKNDILVDWYDGDYPPFDKTRVITQVTTLTPEELAGVKEDWDAGRRY